MDAEVEPGRHPEPDGSGAPAGGSAGGTRPPLPKPAYPPIIYDDDDVTTTILDLRAAFAAAGPPDAAPLGIVEMAPERPGRAAVAFVAVLLLIAGVAGGVVIAIASAGQAAYDNLFGPASCSAAQVTDGATLEQWMAGVIGATGADVEIARSGCQVVGVLDPLTGQAASVTVAKGAEAEQVVASLKETVDCTLGAASTTGARYCTVTIGDRLGVVEYRPAQGGDTVTISVNFR